MRFSNVIKRLGHDESGMTLIDLAFFMIVLSLIAVPFIKQYDQWKMSRDLGITMNNTTAVNKAISDYFYETGRYPCPARANLAVNTPNYGREDCANTLIPSANMHVGAVPFATLKLPMSFAMDAWKNKMTYVVSRLVVAPAAPPFPTSPATGITVQRFAPTCNGVMNTPMTNVHFIVFSHGPSGMGAFNPQGVQVQACTTGANAPRDAENCDADNVFFDDICARSDVRGQDYYDDVVLADDSAPSRMWVYSTAPTADPRDIVSTIAQVGINTSGDQAFPGEAGAFGVDVRGNAMSGDGTIGNPGRLISDSLCTLDGSRCFNPALLGGTPNQQNDCRQNPSVGLRGFWSGTEPNDNRAGARARCQTSLMPSTSNTCAPKYAIGFSGGRILCAP